MPQTHQKPTLTSRVLSTASVNWKDLQFIQQDDFKELPEDARKRLKASILANEFTQPFYVWQEQETGVQYCLDGKHRTLILRELIQEGYDIPDILPATFIDCKDKTDAARLVLVYSSMYAKVTQDGLIDFLSLYGLNYEEMMLTIDLPDFDEVKFTEPGTKQADMDIVARSLKERFIIPPFSVFDTRMG
jgi:hypothetical protein